MQNIAKLLLVLGLLGVVSACNKTNTPPGPDALAYQACSENQMYAYGDTGITVVRRYDGHEHHAHASEDRCHEYERLLARDCRLSCTVQGPSIQTFCGIHKDGEIIRLSEFRQRHCGD